jgi:HD-like signal output (HDOD) protein
MRPLDDYIREAEHLVPAPQALAQILPLLSQADGDTNSVVDLLADNQTLTGNVVRGCTSACFSRKTRIDSLPDAVTRGGFRQIYDIVASIISFITPARPQAGYGVEANELWGHTRSPPASPRQER